MRRTVEFEAAEYVTDEDDDELEMEDNVEDSESHSEDEVDVDAEDMEEDDEDEDLGSDDSVHEQEEEEGGSHEQATAMAAAPAPPDAVRVRTRTPVANVTVCDADALGCGVCFLALRPPIFQCEVGHVVCSDCRVKLEATPSGNKCHVCGVVAARGGYRRCHAMEHLLDCIRVPCPKATAHRQVCPHAPCHCPAGESCGFIGSTAALLDHFAGAHSWPCTSGSKVRAGKAFSISLRVGFNFVILLADQDHDRDDGEQPATTGSVVVPCRLFLLNVTQERLGRAISVMCIHPHANGVDQPLWTTKCKLAFSHFGSGDENENLCRSHYHYQASEFKVVSTDLSNGLPIPDSCFQFIVPNAVLGDDDKDYIKVKVCISIN
ncbi:hypothetical protein BDA96_09G051000 [Sorghum bicolor]|uniref:RING-type E3 ubiquitin transferase n=1 Tax=Sorghum bicolor TaxID=4558 RepID=A0A921Q9W9_SORBI|nr:hypothetical protein BDA96_09G051000 [Sorghum bicolor]